MAPGKHVTTGSRGLAGSTGESLDKNKTALLMGEAWWPVRVARTAGVNKIGKTRGQTQLANNHKGADWHSSAAHPRRCLSVMIVLSPPLAPPHPPAPGAGTSRPQASKASPASAGAKQTDLPRGTPVLAIHGGAGGTLPPHIPPRLEAAYRASLQRALCRGYEVLAAGGTALGAVCRSVEGMEDDALFNAAHGAVFTTAGTNECEASVMSTSASRSSQALESGHKGAEAAAQDVADSGNGMDVEKLAGSQGGAQSVSTRRCASAVLVRNTRNPVLLAKTLLHHAHENPHVILSGVEAERIGWKLGCTRVDDDYYYTHRRWVEHRRDLGLPDEPDPILGEGGCAGRQARTREVEIDCSQRYASKMPSGEEKTGNPFVEEAREYDDPPAYHLQAETEHLQATVPVSANASVDPPSENSEEETPTSFDLPRGTVGAVALDKEGNLAVATSTGGKTNKLPGRIGDTPTPGAGFWAESWAAKDQVASARGKAIVRGWWFSLWLAVCSFVSLCLCCRQSEGSTHRDLESAANGGVYGEPSSCDATTPAKVPSETMSDGQQHGVAVSGTGDGDYFLRTSFASLVVHRMRFLGEPASLAGQRAIDELGVLGGIGGAILVDKQGRVSFPMNSSTMNRGYIVQAGKPKVALFAGEECS